MAGRSARGACAQMHAQMMRSLVLLHLLWAMLLRPSSSGDGGSGSCCDAHPELCRPLSPQPQHQSETVAFHAPGMYGAEADSWLTYDFDKLTAIGMFTSVDPELLCRAHANRVRVLDWFTCNGPNGDPAYHGGIQLNPHNQPWMLLNATEIAMYVEYSTACIVKHGLDGMVIDVESLPWPSITTFNSTNATANAIRSEVRSGLTDLICALKHALRVAIPGSILTFTTSNNPIGYSNAMDYAALSECLDCASTCLPLVSQLPAGA